MILYVSRTPNGLREYPLHTHKQYEIMLYLQGTGELRTPQKNIPFCPGTVIIVPPGIEHGSSSKHGFRNISVGGNFGELLCFDDITVSADNEQGEGKLLATLLYKNRYANGSYLSSLCSAYLQFLLQNLKIENGMKNTITALCDSISRDAFRPDINLSSLLESTGYSEDYIRSRFRQVTGKTPNQYLTEIRLSRARFLIEIYGDSLPLSEIAARCGYSDYVYFSKKFKMITGHSPRRYAKEKI